MDITEFKTLLKAFAESPDDVSVSQGRVIFQLREDVIDVQIGYSDTDDKSLIVTENGVRHSARTWILNRVARLPQLADRIISTLSTDESIREGAPFIRPHGLMSPELAAATDTPLKESDAVQAVLNFAKYQSPGATSVMYLTSDAGEGKTTVINKVALLQAQGFKARNTSSLIVPIPLSGRAFLTFDDAVIAALVNRLRFNYFYFDAFLALVRLGAIVPAFDGYEEMLVEGSKGEAVSALGGLVQSLESSGLVVVAARKAFFDYVSFKSQARLLDAIGNHSATFSRLELMRWDRTQFIDFGRQRGINSSEVVYQTVADRLSADHPLLTRAVLVNRLLDVASSEPETGRLAELLGANPHDYFYTFVDAIIQREATKKWLARVSGEVMEPLLTVPEHHELLSQIAIEMWQSGASSIRFDLLDVVVDLFTESRKKPAIVVRQVRERIKQHSLLVTDSSKGQTIAFDHEDFQNFFLGEGLGNILMRRSRADLYSVLSVDELTTGTVDQAVQYLLRGNAALPEIVEDVKAINAGEAGFSYCKENCGQLVLRLVEALANTDSDQRLVGFYFPTEGLAGRGLRNVVFDSCHFQPTCVRNTRFEAVQFENCDFERLDLVKGEKALSGSIFSHCQVEQVSLSPDAEYLFDPQLIVHQLRSCGAGVTEALASAVPLAVDDEIKLLERFLRVFLRMTQVNEEIIRIKFGNAAAPKFMEDVLPSLLSRGVVAEVPWHGKGVQRRFRLSVPLSAISDALEASRGSFANFLDQFS